MTPKSMPRPAHADTEADELASCCPFQDAIDLLSRRHAMTIIWLLQQQEPRRFNDIKRAIDVNPVTLTQRLTELVQVGIVGRKTYNETPPRVEYSLTPKGRDLVPLMDQLSKWARKHQVETAASAA
jgi:DNA-binding HxlR family transcriptional regulator